MKNDSIACPKCNSQVEAESSYCPACGFKLETGTSNINRIMDSITWETDITLMSNPLFVRQLLLVAVGAGLLLAFLMVFIFIATGEYEAIPMMLLISLVSIIGLALFLFLITLIFFGNRTRVRFTVDQKGAYWETTDDKVKSANRLAVLAGILGRSPQTAGAGALAVSREKEMASWDQLSNVEVNKRQRMIVLRNSWRPVLMLVCQPENYETILQYVNSRVKPGLEEISRKSKPMAKGLLRTLYVCIAIFPLFYLTSPFVLDLDIFMPLFIFIFTLATVWLIPLFGWVVIAGVVVVFIQLLFNGVSGFSILYGYEQIMFLLAFVGLGYLAWFSWGSLRGRFLPPLLEN